MSPRLHPRLGRRMFRWSMAMGHAGPQPRADGVLFGVPVRFVRTTTKKGQPLGCWWHVDLGDERGYALGHRPSFEDALSDAGAICLRHQPPPPKGPKS